MNPFGKAYVTRYHAVMHQPTLYRTIWISDVHLGTRAAKAAALLDFLQNVSAEQYYLNGDIFDGWRMRRGAYWDKYHNALLMTFLQRANDGAKIIFIPGNHDEVLRDFIGLELNSIILQRDAVHTLADGRQMLVMHGDEFDLVVRNFKFLARLGAGAYGLAMLLNFPLNFIRRTLNLPYWSLSAYLKNKVKGAVELAGHFEQAVVREATERGVQGIICGHTHNPHLRTIGEIEYCNIGDWVESCSALVEHADGRLEIIRWPRTAKGAVTLVKAA